MSSLPSDNHDTHIVQAVTIRWYNACAHYAVSLARGLNELGYRVTVAGGKDTPALKRAEEYGIPVLSHPVPSSYDIAGYYSLIHTLRKYVASEDVSLVNVHNGFDHTAWLLGLRGTGMPLIRTSGNQYPPKVHPLSRLIMHNTDGVISSARLIHDYYTKGFGIPESTVSVVNGGVDNEFFSPQNREESLRQSLGIPDDAFVFGIIGRFSPVKGHRYFFEAAGKIAVDCPDAWFLAAGWDAQLKQADIQAMARDAGIQERTRFAGRLNNSRKLISTIDTGVITSVGSETICRIAMEYMAMGLPVIASDTNSVPEIIRNGQSGIIVPAKDSDALADAMLKILSDREYALDLGCGGRHIVERDYSLSAFARKTIDIYRRYGINAGKE